MTLITHRQQDIGDIDPCVLPTTIAGSDLAQLSRKACGASCILCAEAELEGKNVEIKALDALKLYIDIAEKPGADSVVSKVVAKCSEKNLYSELIQNTELMDDLCGIFPAINANRSIFETDTESLTKTKMTSFAGLDDLFGDHARVMLVVAFHDAQKNAFATHWILARQDDSQPTSASGGHRKKVMVMNPDGGKNYEVTDLWEWLTKAGQKSDDIHSAIGPANYIFAGVALRLTKVASQTRK